MLRSITPPIDIPRRQAETPESPPSVSVSPKCSESERLWNMTSSKIRFSPPEVTSERLVLLTKQVAVDKQTFNGDQTVLERISAIESAVRGLQIKYPPIPALPSNITVDN
jgi:hypothetical protein